MREVNPTTPREPIMDILVQKNMDITKKRKFLKKNDDPYWVMTEMSSNIEEFPKKYLGYAPDIYQTLFDLVTECKSEEYLTKMLNYRFKNDKHTVLHDLINQLNNIHERKLQGVEPLTIYNLIRIILEYGSDPTIPSDYDKNAIQMLEDYNNKLDNHEGVAIIKKNGNWILKKKEEPKDQDYIISEKDLEYINAEEL